MYHYYLRLGSYVLLDVCLFVCFNRTSALENYLLSIATARKTAENFTRYVSVDNKYFGSHQRLHYEYPKTQLPVAILINWAN